VPKCFLLLIVTSALVACGSGAPVETTATSAPAGATTITTAPAPVYTVENPTLAPPDPMTNSEGASGSGCTDGGPPTDGIWYGYVTANTADSVVFELACLYFGDIAWEKAAEDGNEAPNDVYITATGQAVEVPVVEGATAYTIVAPANSELRIDPLPYSDWPQVSTGYTPCPGEFCSVWLYVNNGVVTEVLEQYLP
jgi:hypothetical protein